MSQPPTCPGVDHLRELLEANLAPRESDQLAKHVETCEQCQKTLDELTAANAPWPNLSAALERGTATELALARAMAQLGAGVTIQAPAVAAPAEEQALTFLDPPEQPGHLGRLGNYEVLEIIGRGGMGVVLKAFDAALQRVVAIKVLAPQLALNALAHKRFVREAQAAAAINHDHVVTIHAVDQANGVPYMVMQYVPGQSLEQRLGDANTPLELDDILHIARQTAAGLAAAHAQGLIHRDIKPANILLQTEPAGGMRDDVGPPSPISTPQSFLVKITDFGLARPINDVSLSQSGVVSGTPFYMSPEQITGGAIDHRSDLYSLGILLYRIATGQEPFLGEDVNRVWAQHLFERPVPPSEAAPTPLPAFLENLILRLLQKEPAARPQSAEEVIRCLDQSVGGIPAATNEEARLAVLRKYRILDTDPEQAFDDLAFLASHVCGTPIALITLVDADRQWFKSRVGMSLRETARDISFCTHTIQRKDMMMVNDARQDERFATSSLVCGTSNVRFYAGFPLITPEGHALGAMCVMDHVPRQLNSDQTAALAALSRLVLRQLELRRDLLDLKDALAESKGNQPASPAPKETGASSTRE